MWLKFTSTTATSRLRWNSSVLIDGPTNKRWKRDHGLPECAEYHPWKIWIYPSATRLYSLASSGLVPLFRKGIGDSFKNTQYYIDATNTAGNTFVLFTPLPPYETSGAIEKTETDTTASSEKQQFEQRIKIFLVRRFQNLWKVVDSLIKLLIFCRIFVKTSSKVACFRN